MTRHSRSFGRRAFLAGSAAAGAVAATGPFIRGARAARSLKVGTYGGWAFIVIGIVLWAMRGDLWGPILVAIGISNIMACKQETLAAIGEFLDVDHCETLRISTDERGFHTTHRWTRPGTRELVDPTPDFRLEKFPYFASILRDGKPMQFDDCAETRIVCRSVRRSRSAWITLPASIKRVLSRCPAL